MTGYVHVSAEQIPKGTMALLLFVDNDELCAGVIEHCTDGRLDRRVPDKPSPNDLVLVICRLMAKLPQSADLLVVIEPGAFWPDAFPELRKFYRSRTRARDAPLRKI